MSNLSYSDYFSVLVCSTTTYLVHLFLIYDISFTYFMIGERFNYLFNIIQKQTAIYIVLSTNELCIRNQTEHDRNLLKCSMQENYFKTLKNLKN